MYCVYVAACMCGEIGGTRHVCVTERVAAQQMGVRHVMVRRVMVRYVRDCYGDSIRDVMFRARPGTGTGTGTNTGTGTGTSTDTGQ